MFVTPAFAQDTGAEDQLHTETGVAHETGHSGAFPPFDTSTYASQLLWLVITFGLFYLLMQKVIVPRVGGILENRHDRIAQDLDEAARLKSEADAAIETYEKELAAARAKGQDIAGKARDEAKAKAEVERQKVEAELMRKIEAAEAHIAEIKAKAFADVDEIASEAVGAVVNQLIGAKVTKTDIKSALTASAKEA
ncbi:F0F1 ATP synthase subunit B [Rhizobium halophytocola]|nr:F0F1 ATP synthase subunit B [Rhizobium halophytocola]